MFGSQTDRGGTDPRPTAVEVHSLPADVSLRQLRDLINQGSPGQVLQSIAALDSSEQGVALIILASEQSAVRVVELLDGYPLGGSYLHVKRADSLPSSLVNLLYSLEQASPVSERGRVMPSCSRRARVPPRSVPTGEHAGDRRRRR